MVFAPFGLKTVMDLACFGLKSRMVFEGIRECMGRICLFQFQMNKKEKVICEFQMGFKKPFSWRSKK